MDRSNGALVLPDGRAVVHLDEVERRQYDDTLDLMQERLDELESALSGAAELTLAADDLGWQRLTGEADFEFSRASLRRISRLCRLAFIKNPLINRAVTLQAMYVWGQGVSISARHPDVDAVVQSFLDDVKNQSELTSHQARALKEQDLQVDGNLFFVFFANPTTGRVRLRTIPPDQVADIVTNPEDAKDVWFYKRVWTPRSVDGQLQQTQTRYYPDWRHMPTTMPTTIAGEPVERITPVYHVKVGGLSDMRFGVPEVYAAIDWAKAYKSFLEDWATITRALSRFAWNLSTKGGAKGVAAAKAKLGTTLGTGNAFESNPAPVTGSTFIGADGIKLDPIKTSGVTASAEDGRRLLLMVAAAVGLPESFFGDVSVGTLATAKSLDRPTELKFQDRRTLWADVLTDILQFVIGWAVTAPRGMLAGRGTVARDADGQMTITMEDDPETSAPLDVGIDISFPSILEHDVETTVGAIVAAATLAGHPSANTLEPKLVTQLLLGALGEDDIDETLDRMYPGDEDGVGPPEPDPPADPAAPPDAGAVPGQQPGQAPPQAGRRPTSQEAFTEALRDLRGVLASMKAGEA